METIIFIDNLELIKKLRQDLIDNGFVDDKWWNDRRIAEEDYGAINKWAKEENRNIFNSWLHIEEDKEFGLYNHDDSDLPKSYTLRLTATESNYNEVLTTIIERYKTSV